MRMAIVIALTLAGCHGQKAISCFVNQDCPGLEYFDGPATMVNEICVEVSPGVCRPMDSTTIGAPCKSNDDCKAAPLVCDGSCVTFECISGSYLCDDASPCEPPSGGVAVYCGHGCRAGSRNWSCSSCFCPSCSLGDAGPLTDATASEGGADGPVCRGDAVSCDAGL